MCGGTDNGREYRKKYFMAANTLVNKVLFGNPVN
jgi:hypothetical protein